MPVGKRDGRFPAKVKGFFPGATVVRGSDWKYSNEDGWFKAKPLFNVAVLESTIF